MEDKPRRSSEHAETRKYRGGDCYLLRPKDRSPPRGSPARPGCRRGGAAGGRRSRRRRAARRTPTPGGLYGRVWRLGVQEQLEEDEAARADEELGEMDRRQP
eukprot:15471333-Alexandrium_andersonii.AAC.1